jgi:tRNA U34 2-thiouridine synthase MnmA/TrmU
MHTHDTKAQKKKAVALLSGGLDSNLAVRIMRDQGVEVEAVSIKTPFCDFDCGRGCGHNLKEAVSDLGVKLKTIYLGEEYLKMVMNPKYGYGSGMNPCIDCRAMMYKCAKSHMDEIGADFLITGEVLSQRPMSQNKRALQLIEKTTEMEGKVVRPLSARNLPSSDPEKAGLIKREDLYSISGRSRKEQLKLAKRYGIIDPPNAAGGCLLTDKGFSNRLKDLITYVDHNITLNDVELLKVGRHFRLSDNVKLIVGRNEEENEIVAGLAMSSDLLMESIQYKGPVGMIRGSNLDSVLDTAAAVVNRYSDSPRECASAVRLYTGTGTRNLQSIDSIPCDESLLDKLRI